MLSKHLLDMLSPNLFFEGIDSATITTLNEELFEVRQYAPEAMIVRENDPSDEMFLIVSGVVKITKNTQNGSEIEIFRRGPNEFVGEIGIIQEQPRSANLYAAEPTTMVVISRSAFLRLIEQIPPLRRNINRRVTSKIQESDSKTTLEIVRSQELAQLNEKIQQQKRVLEIQQAELMQTQQLLTAANQSITEKNKKITDSIHYALRIQHAILPRADVFARFFEDYFIFYRPKDIVSGDFYWIAEQSGYCFVAVVDCTGHGVPGALLSMVGTLLLDDLVTKNHVLEPEDILRHLHLGVRRLLNQEAQPDTTDGMDVCLIRVKLANSDRREPLVFAGARRPLFIFDPANTAPELLEIKGDRKSIGGRQKESERLFTRHELSVPPGSRIYLTSDGFVDQSNPDGKKFGTRRLRELLVEIGATTLTDQDHTIKQELKQHQLDEPQRDDMTFIGLAMI